MAESKYRIWAKAVAIYELVVNFISIGLIIFWGIAVLFFGVSLVDKKDTSIVEYFSAKNITVTPPRNDGAVALGKFLGGGLLIFCIIVLAIYIYFSYNLLKAATIGTDAAEACHRAERWRILATVALTLSFVSLFNLRTLPVNIVMIILRIASLWVVGKFIGDMQRNAEQEDSAPPKYGGTV